ncbi:lactadherin-like [Stylophora pistillata]|uniref:lactadherin-like n=1 Tax=Stylophora pistillata TaxID=50429 RepID=UPI000C042027|nr:lactadherin-like [Stylophora pistillata]
MSAAGILSRGRRAVPDDPFVDIDIRSEGCDDPKKTPDTCGIAYIRVDGKDHSRHRRGHNVVIVDRKTAKVLSSEAFDTHGDGSAGTRLRDFLNAQGADKLVLIGVQDSASSHVGVALDAIRRLGAADPILVDFRGSFALIGTPDASKPPWIAQDQHHRYKGPSEISKRIPLSDCQKALGMENYGIPNGQVQASSEWDPNHAAIQGRLHYKPPRGKQGAWSARSNNENQWLQVDLGSEFTKVTGVATQGRYNYNQWVTKYKLQYSNDPATFTYYREPGEAADKVFDGNTDQNTVVYHFLNAPIKARYIRFRPVTWSGHISMRVELYGCSACGEALGMASYAIPNGQVTASSEWDLNHAAIQGRLHYIPPPGKQGGWSARHNNANQWLQIDLGALFRVTGVATQGRSNYNQWVTKYKLQYSYDGVTFTYYMEAGQSAAKVKQTACRNKPHKLDPISVD